MIVYLAMSSWLYADSRNDFCDGSKAKRNPSYTVVLKKPEVKGYSVHFATQLTSAISDAVGEYLKEDLISDMLFGYDFKHGSNSCYIWSDSMLKSQWKEDAARNSEPSIPEDLGRDYYLAFMDKVEDDKLEELFKTYDFPDEQDQANKVQEDRSGKTNPTGFLAVEMQWQRSAPRRSEKCGISWYSTWHLYANAQTTVQQAPQPDGSVRYQVTLNMEGFCKWAISRSSEIAQ
jgi:hypothetical protein